MSGDGPTIVNPETHRFDTTAMKATPATEAVE